MVVAGNDAQKKKYFGRMIEEPLMAVSTRVCMCVCVLYVYYFVRCMVY